MTTQTAISYAGNFGSAVRALAVSKVRVRARRFRVRRQAQPTLRDRVLAAFRKAGHGVEPNVAFRRTTDFYKASGAEWTRGLS